MVQEENPIISEVQFGETSSGAAMVHGAMVGADQARANFNMRNAMESREQTLLNAKQGIRRLGNMLKIPEYIMESAAGWFKLALVQNFVQGRRSNNVIAACLYVACRHEKTHHLLIDFSSIIQISVYSLGATYLKLVRALQIQKLPLADPSLFIQHFAERLDFGDQTAKVCRDATKIAQRMSSDWIHEGRRPAGIAGACLLLAARFNNFRRSHGEIVAVARVGEETIQKRMNEFGKTKSGTMTLSQFRESDETAPTAPPSYQQNRRIEKKILKIMEQREKLLRLYKALANQNKLYETLFEAENSIGTLEQTNPESPQRESHENSDKNGHEDDAADARSSSDDNDLDSNSDDSDNEGEDANGKAEINDENEDNEASEVSDDDIYGLRDAKPVVKAKLKDESFKPVTKRLSGLSSQIGSRSLRSGKSKPFLFDGEDEEDETLQKRPKRSTPTKKRAKPDTNLPQNDSLLKSVLSGGDLTEKEFESTLDLIFENQRKMHELSLYLIPAEIGNSDLFVTEEERTEDRDSADYEGGPQDSYMKEQILVQLIERNRPKNLLKHCPTTESLLKKVSDDPTLDDVESDDEIERMILSPEDAAEKERLWTNLNYDFLIAQEKKLLKQAADEISGNTSGQPRKRRRIKESSVDPVLNDAAVVNAMSLIGEDGKAVTPAESAKQLLQSKNFSRKINYSTIGDLFNR